MVDLSEALRLIGVVVAFVFVIILIRKKYNFGISLILGSLILGGFSLLEIQLIDVGRALIEGSFYDFQTQTFITETIELAILMTLIYMLARLMQQTGAITHLIDSLRTFFSNGGILALIPAVYGLMPVPGGALFSAPMIDEEGDTFRISKEQKNILNIWFRHIWFPIYPISSAMILVCSVDFSNIDIYTLILANVVSFIGSILIGLYLLRHFIKGSVGPKKKITKDYKGLVYLLPPVVPLLFYIVLQFFDFPQIRSFLIGVLFSIFILYLLTGSSSKSYISYIKNSLTLKLALAIFGIMIFREMFEVSKVNIIIASTIQDLAFPAIIMVLLVPLLLGLLTGYNLGAIALSYFLVEPFFSLTGINIIGLTSLIFMSSFVGYLISPIHLCNVLSSEYLKTDTTRIYRLFIPASIILLFIQVIFVFIVYRI